MHLSMTVAFCVPCSAFAFSREKISFGKNCRRPAERLDISSQDLHSVLSDDLIPQQETGIWLDLRQNAIHPKTAVEQLETEIGATSFIDRILVSETVCQNLIDTNDMYLTTSQILYQSPENDCLFSCSSQGFSTPFGNILSTPSDAPMPVEDPIEAIELINGGKWLMLDKHETRIDDQIESLRIDAVGNFLDIVISSSSDGNIWNSSPETSGLVLPRTGTEQQDNNASNFGGVAVACNTKSEVMKLASALQLKQGGGTNSVTESGIILQSSADASAAVSTAVVLPFSVDSWQVATLVFGDDFHEEDNGEI